MIAGRNADQTFAVGLFIVFTVFCNEFLRTSFSTAGEVRLFTAEQIVVMGRAEVKQEVHMEAADEALIRFAPFADHGSGREFLI